MPRLAIRRHRGDPEGEGVLAGLASGQGNVESGGIPGPRQWIGRAQQFHLLDFLGK